MSAENIRAYFRAKWRLLFIYTMLSKYGKRPRDFWGHFYLVFSVFDNLGAFLIIQLFHSPLLDMR